MKFICKQKSLSNKINTAQKAINSKSNNELLKGLKITADQEKISIVGYDSEIAIETIIKDTDIKETGSVVVESRIFGDIIRKLPDSLVEISVDDEFNISIECGNFSSTIRGLDASQFPLLPQMDANSTMEMPQKDLKSMIRQTIFSISQDDTKPILKGELFEVKNGIITLLALDGIRLSLKTCEFEDKNKNEKVIIPGKALHNINSLLGDEGIVKIGFTDKNIFLDLEESRVIARLIKGDFIDYTRIFPKECLTKIKVDTKEFFYSLDRASTICQAEKNNLIRFKIEKDVLHINSNNEIGDVHEVVDIELEGDELEISFNSRYFIEGLKYIEEDEVYIEFTTNTNPCVIKPVNNDNYVYLLVPVLSQSRN